MPSCRYFERWERRDSNPRLFSCLPDYALECLLLPGFFHHCL